jgi:hypothetical protein
MADIRQGVWIYENPNVLPRAYVVHHVEVAPGEELLERLTSPDLNAWTTALIEEPLPSDQMAALEAEPSHTASTAQVVHYGLHKVVVEAQMSAPGLLILGDAYYPGWKATVDGAPAPLLRANYALRGVYLPSGTHNVVFHFSPTPFWIGLTVTSLIAVLGLGYLVRSLCTKRQLAPSKESA